MSTTSGVVKLVASCDEQRAEKSKEASDEVETGLVDNEYIGVITTTFLCETQDNQQEAIAKCAEGRHAQAKDGEQLLETAGCRNW
jgi:hypothetical protein